MTLMMEKKLMIQNRNNVITITKIISVLVKMELRNQVNGNLEQMSRTKGKIVGHRCRLLIDLIVRKCGLF